MGKAASRPKIYESNRFMSLRRKFRKDAKLPEKCTSTPSTPTPTKKSELLIDKSRFENEIQPITKPKPDHQTLLRKTKHIDIKQWLQKLDLLKKYEQLFDRFDGVEDLIDFSEGELKTLGVTRSSDRALMISSLTRLRAKYYDDFNVKAMQRNSVGAFPHKKRLETDNLMSPNESTYEQVQSKSLGDLIMDQTVDPTQISHALRKDLEWELSLDSRDIRSHAWYHGSIPRPRAEDIVRDEGGFLVRDCTSQPGSYVLTTRTKTATLHFVIKKLITQRDTVYEKVQYQFEEDAFDTVADLITYYVGSERPITTASNARIHHPKNRLYPLSYYAVKYPPTRYAAPPAHRVSPTRPPRLPSKKQRSHSLTPHAAGRVAAEKCSSADGVIAHAPLMTRSAEAQFGSLPRQPHAKLSLPEADGGGEAPPKPSRVPTATYHASGSDSGNGSGDSALSSALDGTEAPSRGVTIKNPRYMVESESSTTLKNYDLCEIEEKLMEEWGGMAEIGSRFDLNDFQTLLLPLGENKPLDGEAFITIRNILKETGAMMLAMHLTRCDLDLVFGKRVGEVVIGDGIELAALPHGVQFRLDLFERTQCLRLFVAVTILSCKYEKDRTEMLSKWIEIAIETKTALGNLYGFCGIMLGLCSQRILELDSTWLQLRRQHTAAALNFEAKLRPTLKHMNTCTNPQAPNTTIPHLLPLVLLLERRPDELLRPPAHAPLLGAWEASAPDFGLGTLLAHLEAARRHMAARDTYQRNAAIVLGGARLDELTTDMFRTEFQMRFMWGSRGALVAPAERHGKLEQVLEVMARRCSETEL